MSQLFRKRAGKSNRKRLEDSLSDEARVKIGGINPYSLEADTDDRLKLFERVRKFYVHFTGGKKIKQGLGEIVEWTHVNGTDDFNKKVRAKYKGFDLNSLKEMDEEIARMKSRSSISKHRKQLINRTMSPKTNKPMNSLRNIPRAFFKSSKTQIQSPEPNPSSAGELLQRKKEQDLRQQLKTFFQENNAEMLNTERFEKILEYGLNRGVARLNIKLQKIYGKGNLIEIEDNELDAEGEDSDQDQSTGKQASTVKSIFSMGKTLSNNNFSKMVLDVEMNRSVANRTRSRGQSAMSRSMLLKNTSGGSFTGEVSTRKIQSLAPGQSMMRTNTRNMPPQMRLFLKLYFACYDTSYIQDKKISLAQMEVMDSGMEAMDLYLKKKFKESLTSFQGRVELLQDELHSFYLDVDIKRTNDILMGVLQWTMRNGRSYLNRQLRKKYGCDLDSYRTQANSKPAAAEDFHHIEEPEF